jgi:hypothetical protein
MHNYVIATGIQSRKTREEKKMSTIKKLIEETHQNCQTLESQIEEYKQMLPELLKEFKRDGRILKFEYYPNAFDGRKVCFSGIGLRNDGEFDRMIKDLLISNQMEDFLKHLTQKALPLFSADEYMIPKFYF